MSTRRYLAVTTWDSARLFANRTVDFVFVDADHSEAAVLRDIEAWWPKLKPTGIMAGHDYNRASVGSAVRKIFNPDECIIKGNVWIAHKENTA